MDKITDNKINSPHSVITKTSKSFNTEDRNITLTNSKGYCFMEKLQGRTNRSSIFTNDLPLTPANKYATFLNSENCVTISSKGIEYKSGCNLPQGLNTEISSSSLETICDKKRVSDEYIESPVFRKVNKPIPNIEHIFNTVVDTESEENEYLTNLHRTVPLDMMHKNTPYTLKKDSAEAKCILNCSSSSIDTEHTSNLSRKSETLFETHTQLTLQKFEVNDADAFEDQTLSPENNVFSQSTLVNNNNYTNLSENSDIQDQETVIYDNNFSNRSSPNIKNEFDYDENDEEVIITPVSIGNEPQIPELQMTGNLINFRVPNSLEENTLPNLDVYYTNAFERFSSTPKSNIPLELDTNCNETLLIFSHLSIESNSNTLSAMNVDKNNYEIFETSINDVSPTDMFEVNDSDRCSIYKKISNISEYFVTSANTAEILNGPTSHDSKSLSAIDFLSNYSCQYVDATIKKMFMPMHNTQSKGNMAEKIIQEFCVPKSEICTNLRKALNVLDEIL